jgi:hypothetical protein
MNKIHELDRVKHLLHQALNVALHSMPNDRSVSEARGHMKQAIKKIDVASKRQDARKRMTQDNFQSWWGDIQSGVSNVAASPMSAEAQQRSLSALNSMIDEEKKKLEELEKRAAQPDGLLSE